MTTLASWAPDEFSRYCQDVRAYRYRHVEVVEEYSACGAGLDTFKRWPGPHKNVLNWCVLANGYAVGWNENPATGWSFPMVSLRKRRPA